MRLGNLPLVLVLVAIGAQQLPVAAIGRIVVMVVIPMMYLEQLQVRVGELAAAAAADPGIHLERPLAVAVLTLVTRASRLGDDPVQMGVVRC